MYETLDINLSWKNEDLKVFLPIMTTVVFFSMYWFTAQSKKVKNYFYEKYDFDEASYKHIVFTKVFGFISMGIFPLIICFLFMTNFSLEAYGLSYIGKTTLFSLSWIIGLSILIIPLAYRSARKPKNLVNYPQIRSKVWTSKMVLLNLLGWSLYLFGYEILFRGILLFPLIEPFGVWGAIGVNTALYATSHIPKGFDETIGAIPLGIIFCLLTLASGTIWIAFFVHVTMAFTNTLTALKFNPKMNYIKKNKLNNLDK